MNGKTKISGFTLASLIFPLAIPPVTFFFCALAEGMSLTVSASAVIEQYTVRRQNLFLSGLPGYFPLLLLAAALWIYRRSGGQESTRRKMAWGGLCAIILVLIWVNLQFWPLFLPEKRYPGFPHGLEFVIGPGFFAPIAMLIAVVGIWWAFRENRVK